MANMGSSTFPSRIPILFVVLFGVLLASSALAESQDLLHVDAGRQDPVHNLVWDSSSQSSKLGEFLIPIDSEQLNPFSMDPEAALAGDSAEIITVAEKLTPEVLLSSPRRSGAQPNADGTHALYTVSTYSFESAVKTREIRLFDMRTKRSTLITNDEKASEPHWLETEVLYLKEGEEKGSTELVVASIADSLRSYTAAIVPAAISDLKLKVIEQGKVAVVCTAKTTHEGKLWNEKNELKRNHTGVIYDSTFVRHWDHYVDTTHNALWYGLLTLAPAQVTETKGRYAMSELVNALQGTELESPISPFPGPDHYDIGSKGLVFVAKDPDLNPAFHTKCNFYAVAVSDFSKAPSSAPRLIQAHGLAGAATGPAISPDGKMAVYMQMEEDGYEADRNRVLLVQDLASDDAPIELFKSSSNTIVWDRSPAKAVWGDDGKRLFFLAEDQGNVLVWHADLSTVALDNPPMKLTAEGHVSDVIPLSSHLLFLNGDSLIDNSVWSLIDLETPWAPPVPISSNTQNGAAFGLSRSQVSQIWFKGAEGRYVHAWVVKPSGHDVASGKKLPLALAIHGGPQGAWADSWSTRWNPAVFAEQGYVVVAPNPTGSTSYGQNFTDAIRDNWGGAPYEDLVACFEYIRDHMDDVDTDRAVALGASYGGYMINWIQGHELGRKFKALICHDGVFSTTSDISQDEQYFPIHDHGGLPWKVPHNWEKWSPSQGKLLANWATPQLIIHSEKDYRLAMPEGLGAFNVLQARGVASRLLYFPDENHWIIKEENSRVWHTVVLNWMHQHVGLLPYADEDAVVGPPVGKKYHTKR